MPYSLYSSAVDFHDYFVYMYRTNENDNPLFKYRIGIQVYYTVDGVKNASNIVYLGEMPNFDPLYILGEVNGKTWAANDGVEMTTEDGVTYKAEVKLRRPENEGIRPMVDEVPGIKYCWLLRTTTTVVGLILSHSALVPLASLARTIQMLTSAFTSSCLASHWHSPRATMHSSLRKVTTLSPLTRVNKI